MDWLEQWFGVAPDNGDGSLELLLVLAGATSIIGVVLYRSRAAQLAVSRLLIRGRAAWAGRGRT